MPRLREVVTIDDDVLDLLFRDLVAHDQQSGAYLLYLHLSGRAARVKWKPHSASLRVIAEATGLSKSAVQTAVETLRRRELIVSASDHITAVPRHRVVRHWREQKAK